MLYTKSGLEGVRKVSNRKRISTLLQVVSKRLLCSNFECVRCSIFHWPILKPLSGRITSDEALEPSTGLGSTSPAFRSSRIMSVGLKDESPFAEYCKVNFRKRRFVQLERPQFLFLCRHNGLIRARTVSICLSTQ